MELIDHVTWCRKAIRTRLAQKKAVSAPCHDHDQRPPIAAGASSETSTSPQKPLEMRRMSESASQSGQNFCWEVRLPSNSQPMWAYTRPLVSAFQSLPNRHGECGSPSRSLYL